MMLMSRESWYNMCFGDVDIGDSCDIGGIDLQYGPGTFLIYQLHL